MTMAWSSAAQFGDRPVPARGPGSDTLLLYAAPRPSYGLMDGVGLTALQLGRIDTEISLLPIQAATVETMSQADYVVVYCPTPQPAIPSAVLDFLNESGGPVLWIGFGLPILGDLRPHFEQFASVPSISTDFATNVVYRGRNLNLGSWPAIEVTIPSNSVATAHISIRDRSPSDDGSRRAVAWTSARTTFFAGLPNTFASAALFSDLLLDFYEVRQVPPTQLFVCIEGYHPGSDHGAFQRKVDFLFERRIPFAVAMTPAHENADTGGVEDLEARPDFVRSLVYAQRRGGRIVLGGFVRRSEEEFEFWNEDLDQPLGTNQLDAFRARLPQVVGELVRHGLFPLAWETPGDAAPSALRESTARHFSTALGRLQLSGATRLEMYAPSSIVRDREGRRFLPENLGYLSLAASNEWRLLRERADILLGLRGALAGCEIHDYLPFEKFTSLIDWLESLETPFLDLASLDLWTQWPGGILVTGHASRSLIPPSGTIRWKAFDESGQIINEFTEPDVSGRERTFRNRGAGMVEVYEFLGTTP